jgi:putative addiction module killer protein
LNVPIVRLEGRPRRVVHYLTADEADPYLEWFKTLRSERGRIQNRIDRIKETGSFGDHKPISSDGVWELRWHGTGPGYRVYFGEDVKLDCIVLLCGGIKRTQDADILKAEAYWKDWNNA